MIDLKAGSLLLHQGRQVRVVRPRDLERLIVEDLDTGRLNEVAVHDLSVLGVETTVAPVLGPQQERQEEAEHRYALIAPLLQLRPRSRRVVEARAQETGTSASTLYRLLANYEDTLHLSALARRPRSDQGASRQSPEVVAVMDAVIHETYLSRQQHSIKAVYQELCHRCLHLNLPAPSRDTLARRIRRVTPQERLRRRRGMAAAEGLRPVRGSFPGAAAPLDVVQLDHTELDLMIVDEFERQEIGRPYLTVAIDVMSRVVLGFHISLDAPSYLAAGACLSHAILPKDGFLAAHHKRLSELLQELDTPSEGKALPVLRWPVWGRPTKVHVDNAREFRGKMLERSCHEYGIHVELRPVKKPWYGGHIERLMGTVASEIHNLPGTTFSNIQQRGEYQSQKKAVLTFEELELWLTLFFAGIYNQRPHSALENQSPLAVFQQGLLAGTPDAPPKGLFPRPTPEEALKLQIDFLPSFEVTIQRNGIRLETVTYYHEVLEPYLARRSPKTPSETYVVRRDPRNLSVIYFFAPDVGRYYALPFAQPSWRRMSVWELRELKRSARARLKARPKESDLINEQQAMRRLVGLAGKATRDTRRRSEKKRAHNQTPTLLAPEPSLKAAPQDDEQEAIVPFSVQH